MSHCYYNSPQSVHTIALWSLKLSTERQKEKQIMLLVIETNCHPSFKINTFFLLQRAYIFPLQLIISNIFRQEHPKAISWPVIWVPPIKARDLEQQKWYVQGWEKVTRYASVKGPDGDVWYPSPSASKPSLKGKQCQWGSSLTGSKLLSLLVAFPCGRSSSLCSQKSVGK